MTKAEIIESIAQETGLARKDVSATVEAFMDTVKKSLVERKENVYLRGFGSFVVKHRAPLVTLPRTLPCSSQHTISPASSHQRA